MDYTQPPYQSMPGSGVPGMPGTPVPGVPGQPAPAETPTKKSRKKQAGEGKAPTKKVVNRQFVIATLFAGLAAAAIYGVTTGTAPETPYVAVASGPIATNTEVDANLLKAVQISEELIQPGAVTGTTEQEAR